MSSPSLQACDDRHIGKIVSTEGLTLVLVVASWDGTGRIMQTIVERLAERFPRVHFYVADHDSSKRMGALFNINRLPSLLYLRNGELIKRTTGPSSEADIETYIQQFS